MRNLAYLPMAFRPTTNLRKIVAQPSSTTRRLCRYSAVVSIKPDMRTDCIEPRNKAAVPTRFCVASFQCFRRFPICFETQVCACDEARASTTGTRLMAPTCLDKSAIPTMTSVKRAQASFNSPKTLMMVSTSVARQNSTATKCGKQ